MTKEEAQKAAKAAAGAILRDLTNRRGLRQEWEDITDAVQEEIKAEWARLIALAYWREPK